MDPPRAGRITRTALVAAVLAAFLAATGSSAAAATLVSDDFEDGNSAGWVTTGGTWIVTQEDSRVLHQSSLAANALARTGQPGWRNYTVTAEVTPTSFNGLPGFVGVVARAQSTSNYYALVVRPDDTAALLRTVGGTATTLASARVDVAAGTAYDLSLTVDGRTLTGAVGGVTLTAADSFLSGGPAGLVSTWATASYDDVTVSTD